MESFLADVVGRVEIEKMNLSLSDLTEKASKVPKWVYIGSLSTLTGYCEGYLIRFLSKV